MAPLPKAYGLTGGISTGKSTVADFFRKWGVPVIEADLISREICQKGKEGWKRIKEVFGDDVFDPDGALNRQKLGEMVFSNEKKRKLLEMITHPLIMEHVRGQIREYFDQGQPLVLVEAALLFEAGYDKEFHGMMVVTCSPEQQLERLCQRAGVGQDKALQMISSQMPLSEKAKRATFVIDNSGSLEQTEEAAREVFDKIKAKKERRTPQWN
ncbi:MAG: dephospho-CoA kinase [Deltaproteobacteria bacterium]|nr:dephospho-CoA kinase [Deltaproteobacteria bacterium]